MVYSQYPKAKGKGRLPRWFRHRGSAHGAEDPGSIPGWGQCPGEGNGNLLHYSCLENSMVRGAWGATVHGWQRVRQDWITTTHTFKGKRTSVGAEKWNQFSSVTQLYLTLCDPMDCSMPGRQNSGPSSTPRVYPNPCPLSRWCHPTVSSSVIPFSSCPQSFSASGSFQLSQLFASGGKIIGVSASTSVLPMNTQDWSPVGWSGWISLQSEGLSRVFSNTTVQKHQFFGAQLSL